MRHAPCGTVLRPATLLSMSHPRLSLHSSFDYSNNIDGNGNVFEFEQYGEVFCHPPEPFYIGRDNVHLWNRDRDFAEFEKHFVIGADVDPVSKLF
jgi:hypothetical protein